MTENAISLQQAAKILNLSYSSVFARRYEIGFRLPGSRVWRVWPSTLTNLSARSKLIPLSLRAAEDLKCQSISTQSLTNGGWTSQHQTVKELDDLLARVTGKPRKSCTTASRRKCGEPQS